MVMAKRTAIDGADPAMVKANALFDASEMSLEALGNAMGYTGKTARQSAFQFLSDTADPRLKTLRKFAAAMGVTVESLVAEVKKKGR